jgi:excisionase family DNA binding protein
MQQNIMRERPDIADWERLWSSFELTIAEVAQICRASESHIRNAICAGQLRAYRPSGKGKGPYRIKKRWLEEYQSIGQVVPAPARQKPPAIRAEGGLFKHLDGERLHAAWMCEDV